MIIILESPSSILLRFGSKVRCDGLFLDLHGAMVTQGHDDGEGELLRRIRSAAPDLPIAVALDFEGLFFLILIAPVMVLFYLVFGTMGRDSARRAGPLASGLATGLVLAWALGVSFPLFQG